MNQSIKSISLSTAGQFLPGIENCQQQEGERFLHFSLQTEVNGLVALADLQGTVEVDLQDILPVPQVSEFWLGIINWQGEAVWILDLGRLCGFSHWCRQDSVAAAGMAMLVQTENQTIGLLVDRVKGIKTYDPQKCLPVAEINLSAKLRSLFKGYFLDDRGESSLLLDINRLISVLQG